MIYTHIWYIQAAGIAEQNHLAACLLFWVALIRQILATQSENNTTDYIIRGLPEDEADEIIIETDRDGDDDDDDIEGFSTELVEGTSPTMDR